jgi:hypothetical protein
MKIDIIKTSTTKETIEVELPYYYEADFGGDDYDSLRYGKIEADRTTDITLRRSYGTHSHAAEVQVTHYPAQHMAEWFASDKRSTEEAFEAARRKAIAMLNGESETRTS